MIRLQPWNQKTIASWQENDDKPRHCWKTETLLCQQSPYSQGYGLPSGHVQLWEPHIKKAECQGIDAFELWCWRRLLKVPWRARRSNQSILREINPEYSLEELMLKLKLQYLVISCEQRAHWESPWCWERSKAETEESFREWDGWTASPMQWTWIWANSGR